MEYITTQGERWDTISYKLFGRPDLYHLIFEENKEILFSLKYPSTTPAGIKLNIPDIPEEELAKEVEVPPWKK